MRAIILELNPSDNISLQEFSTFLEKQFKSPQLPTKVKVVKPVETDNSFLNTTTPVKVSPIKPHPKTDYTCGETHWIEGVQVIIHAPIYSDKGTIGRNPNGYRLKDYQGIVHIIPNLARFQRQYRDKLPNYVNLNGMAAGRLKKYNGWTSVQEQYWHIQPYLNLDFDLLAVA